MGTLRVCVWPCHQGRCAGVAVLPAQVMKEFPRTQNMRSLHQGCFPGQQGSGKSQLCSLLEVAVTSVTDGQPTECFAVATLRGLQQDIY